MLKRKARDSIIIAVCVAAVAVIAVLYSLFANKHIFNESKEHLNEIYSQVNTTFLQVKIAASGGRGSVSKASSAAPESFPEFKAAASSSKSTSAPRAALIR